MFGSDEAEYGVWVNASPVIKGKKVSIKLRNGSL